MLCSDESEIMFAFYFDCLSSIHLSVAETDYNSKHNKRRHRRSLNGYESILTEANPNFWMTVLINKKLILNECSIRNLRIAQ